MKFAVQHADIACMLELPKNISSTIRNSYQPCLETSTLVETLSSLSQATQELFSAQELFLVFESEQSPEAITTFVDESRGHLPEFSTQLHSRCLETEVHQRIKKDLLLRFSSISYSAFSWPYARFEIDVDVIQGIKFSTPRDYSILLPISSSLIVHSREERAFFGYMAVFFSSFPKISDDIVQLIILLPELLSDISAAYLRQQ